jgi:hypothetical protein
VAGGVGKWPSGEGWGGGGRKCRGGGRDGTSSLPPLAMVAQSIFGYDSWSGIMGMRQIPRQATRSFGAIGEFHMSGDNG